jgi:hypothetical protein
MHEGLKTGEGSIRSSSFHRPYSIHDRSTNDGRAKRLRRHFTDQTESDRLLGGGWGRDTAKAQVTPFPWPVSSEGVNAMNDPFKTHGAFSWCELMTPDPEAAKRFYGTLFGWTLEDMDMGRGTYTVIKAGGAGIGGSDPPNAPPTHRPTGGLT